MTPRLPKPAPGLAARVVTAVAIGLVTLAVVFFGSSLGLAILVAVIAVLAVAEFYGLERKERRKPNEVFGVIATALMPVSAALFPADGLIAVVTGLMVVSLLWHLAFRQVGTTDTTITVFGALYVGLSLSHLVLLRELPNGIMLVVVTMASIWMNDVFAYFVGVGAGRHKLAPVVSPNKSWEGFFGGAVGAFLLWVAAFTLEQTPLGGTGLPLVWHAVIGIAVPLAALVGDLVESRFKREAGAKDSGVLLPGHGGFLDRFDSTIAVAVTVYYLVVLARAFQ